MCKTSKYLSVLFFWQLDQLAYIGYQYPILLVAKEHKGSYVCELKTPLNFKLKDSFEKSLKQAYAGICKCKYFYISGSQVSGLI